MSFSARRIARSCRSRSASACRRGGIRSIPPSTTVSITACCATTASRRCRRACSLGAYRRLNTANGWGDPLSVGSSISALLWAHDEGFYFRSAGAELTSTTPRDGAITWRLFAERQDDAEKHTNLSLWHALGGAGFIPNIRAEEATAFGLGAQYH